MIEGRETAVHFGSARVAGSQWKRTLVARRPLGLVLLAVVLLQFTPGKATAASAPGPDAFGYTVAQTTNFSFLQITNLGSTHVLYFDDDSAYTNANLGFTFNFYGTNYTNVSFNVNGLMTFGGASTNFFNVNLTNTTLTNSNLPAIAVLWDDWETRFNGHPDGVYFKTVGTAGSRQFIVQWNKIVPINGDGVDDVTFEARLFEGSNKILLSYLDVVVSDETTLPPNAASRGVGATVGIRDLNGQTNGRNLQWSYNQAVITNGLNLLFSLPNHSPVATNDTVTTAEDTPVTINVRGNDSDVDGDPLTITAVTQGANGTVTINGGTNVTYTPNSNYFGSDSFTYTISDGQGGSASGSVIVTVTAVNDPPIATNDSFAVNEDNLLTVAAPGVLANDSDIEGDPLRATVLTTPANGTLVLNTNGSFVYQPNTNFNGIDSFTYRASDGFANSGIATVTITVIPVNDPPAVTNDTYTVSEGNLLTVSAPGVLGNDADPEGDPFAAILVVGPAHGSLTFQASGAFVYQPNANFNGTDSFTYQASDGSLTSAVATATITVTPVNTPPLAANNTYTLNEDESLTVAAPGVLGNDSDPDGDPLTAVLITGPTNGVLTLNATGAFTYQPNTNFHGTDGFVYVAHDGSLSSSNATVTITVLPVNDPPAATNDTFTVSKNTLLAVAAPGVLGNDSDLDGDPLTAVLITGPTNGVLTLNTNGGFDYLPGTNFSGTDSFVYVANDGSLNSSNATVTITVTAANVAPLATNDSYSVSEDNVLAVATPGILGNDADIDGDLLTVLLISGPTNGVLTLNANGAFVYRPNTNFHGSDSFAYVAHDGVLNSGSATVTITVLPINHAPSVTNDTYAVNEDELLIVAAPGVLSNDADVEGDPFTALLVTGPTNGVLTLNTNGSFTYQPATNFHGAVPFTYRATDGSATSATATVTITVLPVNDPPVATNASFTIEEDGLLSLGVPGVLGYSNDPDGDPLTAILVTGPAHGVLFFSTNGSLLYHSDLNFNGTDTFTYQASDGSLTSATATVTITVTAVNDPPTVVVENYTMNEDSLLVVAAPGVLGNDFDPEGDPFTAFLDTSPTNGVLTFNADGAFTYQPNSNFSGSDFFRYRATDGYATSLTARVNITVLPVNDPPTGFSLSSANVTENQPTNTAVGAFGSVTDPDVGDSHTFNLVTGTGSTDNASFTIVSNVLQTAAVFNLEARTNYSIRVRATDTGGLFVEEVFTIRVLATNQPPIAGPDTTNTHQNVPLTLTTAAVLANDSDPDGDTLSVTNVSADSIGGGTINWLGNSITYIPPLDFTGTDSFTYTVSDGRGGSTTGTVEVVVWPLVDVIAVAMLPSGNVRIQFKGIPLRVYVIESSDNMEIWMMAGSRTADAAGLFEIEDTDAPGLERHYFRVKASW